jgi:hypothetical protein
MKAISIFAFMFFILNAKAQNSTFDYFDLSSPGNKISLFAPGITSLENSKEYALAISPLGNEVFFAVGTWPECKIMHVKKNDNQWSKPEVAAFFPDCYAVEPAFSPDGNYLYFSSSKGEKDIKQYCIWRIEKVGNKWGNAKKVIDMGEPDIWEFHPSIANNGAVYFCSWDSKENKGSIYKSDYSDGIYAEPAKVDIPFERECSVTNPYVDPAVKFVIISAKAENSKTGYDAFISYRKGEKWSEPLNFGTRFNSSEDDDSFDVSPDGRFLFIYKQNDIYWTETKNVIK